MREIRIDPKTKGQRLDKFLKRYLPEAGTGFLYRMLREKKIVVNGKKAEGGLVLKDGDTVTIYFSDATLERFSGKREPEAGADPRSFERRIVFENGDMIIYNKPAGMLTQRDGTKALSLNDLLISYLEEKGKADLRLYRPSAVNRLDRNTSGLVLCAGNLRSAQILSEMIRTRKIRKEYICLVSGRFDREGLYESFSKKDQSAMATRFTCIKAGRKLSFVNAELITGRTHQIRQQLADLGHPIAGDPRYGDAGLNRYLREKYGLKRQYLHAYRLAFPKDCGEMPDLAGRVFEEKRAEDLPLIKAE